MENTMPLSGPHPPAQRRHRPWAPNWKLLWERGPHEPGDITTPVPVVPGGPLRMLGLMGRRNGFLFLKVALRLGCTFIEFQGCPEGIKRRARC